MKTRKINPFRNKEVAHACHLVLRELHKKNSIVLTNIALYQDILYENKWSISSLEQERILVRMTKTQAVAWFVELESPQLIIQVLGEKNG